MALLAAHVFPALFVLGLLVPAAVCRADSAPPLTPRSAALLKRLTDSSGARLNRVLEALGSDLAFKSALLGLSNVQVDTFIARLTVIQEADPYQVEVETKGGPRLIYPNRREAERCIFDLRFLKIANDIRRLPMKERVQAIFDGMAGPPRLQYDTAGLYGHELVVAGREAVPFIITHKPERTRYQDSIIWSLGAIGDPRGIDYLIEALQTRAGDVRGTTTALAKFRDDRVIGALVAALKDETYLDVDKHMPQVLGLAHDPYIGRCYATQMFAAETLTTVTGKDWGFLYNEDFKTWSTWLGARYRTGFDPRAVTRDSRELSRLIEHLYHRYMAGRPNPWQPQNALGASTGIASLAGDLKPLGKRVVPIIMQQHFARLTATPAWQRELTAWTRALLEALAWPEATSAAERL